MNIPLEAMEKLEKKYNVELHIIQYPNQPDEFYEVRFVFPFAEKQKQFLGNTLEKVEEKLKNRSNKNN